MFMGKVHEQYLQNQRVCLSGDPSGGSSMWPLVRSLGVHGPMVSISCPNGKLRRKDPVG
ncbi:hypothetical protein IHE45_01G000100 [Dioscorea alata]|uniref:Uncharacterized protein n=1 Tax=Dioscorea alata TaxID=55571 RepID=A0ACB7WSD5_DIOAL|nr:hypothetical protein IHE45_01G000100 [Dioscorea alata]